MTQNNVDQTLGSIIKSSREKQGLTQKDLAEKLNVTPQAVSRWENDQVEPDIKTIKEIASIFQISTSTLLGDSLSDKEEVKPNIKEDIKENDGIQILGNCVKCGRKVTYNNVGRTMSLPRYYSSGRTQQLVPPKPELTCKDCVKKEEELKRLGKIDENKQLRNKAFRRSGIWASLFLIVGFFVIFSNSPSLQQILGPDWVNILVLIVLTYLTFATIFVVTIDNTFVGDMIATIFSWGFVRMPGLIFSLSLDGIIWLLTVKLALFIISTMIALSAGLLALIIGLPISGIVFPFSLNKSIHEGQNLAQGGQIA